MYVVDQRSEVDAKYWYKRGLAIIHVCGKYVVYVFVCVCVYAYVFECACACVCVCVFLF